MSEQDADIEALMHEGSALHGAGAIGRAELVYKLVLKKQRNHPGALHLLGVITCQRGDSAKGIRFIERALALQPEFSDAYSSLATIYLNIGDAAKALDMAAKAVSQNEVNLPALRSQANAQMRLRDFHGAITTFERMAQLSPDNVAILTNWASTLLRLGQYEDAEKMYARATDLEPENHDAWCFRAQALKGQGRFGESLAMLEKILADAPEYIAALIHAGDALQALGRDDEAIQHFREVISLQPDHAEAHFNLGVALLAKGAYREGWPEYAWRFKMEAYAGFRPPVAAPIWSGEPPDGKRILLYAEQGLGDTIQFARYATPLSRQGAEVHCLCSNLLTDVVATIDGVSAVYPYASMVPRFDFQISMMELPHIFASDTASVPGKDKYVSAPGDVFQPLPGPSVGVVWQGNAAHKNDAFRSIPLEHFERVFSIENINFYSLQMGAAADAITALGWQDRIDDLSPGISNFSDSADIISKLDLVISVDTSVAHLAGALGVPVWVLLPTIADWRWGRSSETTCWYNSMRLFRQSALGQWDRVLDDVETALSQFLSTCKASY